MSPLPARLHQMLRSFQQAIEGTETVLDLFWHLFKSYIIMLNALRSLEYMMQSKFCSDRISFLLDLNGTDIVELRSTEVYPIKAIGENLDRAIREVLEDLDENHFATVLSDLILPHCRRLLERVGFKVPEPRSIDLDVILGLIRTLVLFLDYALVSYVSSHNCDVDGSRNYLNAPLTDIGDVDALLTFRCSAVRLACLDAFLDERKVWVFQLRSENTMDPLRERDHRTAPKSVLAHMTDIADVWGPVYTVLADSGLVKYYGVSKGVICRVSTKQDCPIKGAVQCHYFSRSSFYRRKVSRLLSGGKEKDLLLATDDLLLIGSGLSENHYCKYSIEDFSHDWASEMTVLGTQESVWKTDTRSLAIGFSKYIGVTVSGSQKLMPRTTRKQHILDKWTNAPSRCNPGILNQYLGVEISHCTGNARRISLRQLMVTNPILSIFARQIPDWTQTEWGISLIGALAGPDNEAIFRVWKEHARYRPQMAELFCGVFELLDSTGWKDSDKFHAALLTHDEERAVQIHKRLNDWTVALKDTHLTSAYVIVNEKCLDCQVPDHSTSTCYMSYGFTVLQTQLAMGRQETQEEQLSQYRLGGSDIRLKRADCGSSKITLFTLKSSPLLPFPSLRTNLDCFEISTGSPSLMENIVYFRSTHRSFHGMFKEKRSMRPQPVADTTRERQITTGTIQRNTHQTVKDPQRTYRPDKMVHPQNGAPVEPHQSRNKNSPLHRFIGPQRSWLSTFFKLITKERHAELEPPPKRKTSRTTTSNIGHPVLRQEKPLPIPPEPRISEDEGHDLRQSD
ncbi:MAG: hypothetical protein Q9218_004147, partial [Villophora microphyllina]